MKIAVCDDERMIRELLCGYLNEYNNLFDIRCFSSGEEITAARDSFDIIFLDVQMTGIDGMETAKRLRAKGCGALIIFLTSYMEYVFDAFKVNTFRYLPKPLEKGKFLEALSAAEREIKANRKVTVSRFGETSEIALDKLAYLEAFGDGTYLHCSKSEYYESGLALKEWETKLSPHGFFRISRSMLVSLGAIQKYSGNEVWLKGFAEPFTVSRRSVTDFKNEYMNYIKTHAHIF